MADIRSYPIWRHLRSEPSSHVLRYRNGKLVGSGRGLAFFFRPMNTSVAEIPVDDRDLIILFHGRSRDFQEITVQGSVTFRIVDAPNLGQRFDFSIDLNKGVFLRQPLDQIASLLTGMAQAIASEQLAGNDLAAVLATGVRPVQEKVATGLRGDASIKAMGIEIVSVRIADMRPTPELEKALQTPTRESIQQQADKATFERRAMAVEKERAIQENELQNQIELAKREESLIEQRGQNQKRQAQDETAAQQIRVESEVQVTRLRAQAAADSIRLTEGAKVGSERERMEIYRTMPGSVMAGLAARELATKLQQVENINVTPDLLGPLLSRLVKDAGRPAAT